MLSFCPVLWRQYQRDFGNSQRLGRSMLTFCEMQRQCRSCPELPAVSFFEEILRQSPPPSTHIRQYLLGCYDGAWKGLLPSSRRRERGSFEGTARADQVSWGTDTNASTLQWPILMERVEINSACRFLDGLINQFQRLGGLEDFCGSGL